MYRLGKSSGSGALSLEVGVIESKPVTIACLLVSKVLCEH